MQFYYTDEFADVTSDPVAYIQGLVDSANTVYNKSKVPLQMYARCFTRLSSVKESNDAIDTLTKFRNSQGKANHGLYVFVWPFGLEGLWLRYAAKFDPFLSLDCAPALHPGAI